MIGEAAPEPLSVVNPLLKLLYSTSPSKAEWCHTKCMGLYILRFVMVKLIAKMGKMSPLSTFYGEAHSKDGEDKPFVMD